MPKAKKKIMRATREWELITYKESSIRTTANFHQKPQKPETSGMIYLKFQKKNGFNQEICILQNYPLKTKLKHSQINKTETILMHFLTLFSLLSNLSDNCIKQYL